MRLVGGPADGRETDGTVLAPTVLVPVATREWTQKYGEWQDQYGVQWAMLYVDHIPENPVIPPEPPMPSAEYRLTQADNGERSYVFSGWRT